MSVANVVKVGICVGAAVAAGWWLAKKGEQFVKSMEAHEARQRLEVQEKVAMIRRLSVKIDRPLVDEDIMLITAAEQLSINGQFPQLAEMLVRLDKLVSNMLAPESVTEAPAAAANV